MHFRILFSLIFFLLFTLAGQAQPALKPAGKLTEESIARLKLEEDTLAILAFAVVNDSIEAERFASCRKLITNLVRALKTENSFNYPFDRLKSVSIMAPTDSTFRIFTWQLFVNDSTYRYYGAIQKNTGELSLFPLIDRSYEMDEELPASESLTHDRWYGALYYNVLPFVHKKQPHYLLLGYDAFQFFDKRKVIDVLSFDKAGKPVFGAAVFEREKGRDELPELRIFIEYSAEASVRCNYDDLYGMILFEHLIPMPSPFGRGITYVPDGSYDGFKLEKGRWKFVDKVFNDVQAEPPSIEMPKDDGAAKDIFGKEKKKKKKKGATP